MAILRAGPWGNLNSTHEDPWTDFSQEPTHYPVNCAKSNWPNQDWKTVYVLDSDPGGNIYYGTTSLGANVGISGSIYPYIQLIFCYQATQGFDVDFNWTITGSNFAPTLTWDYETIEGDTDSFFNTPANSGTETISLPATTFGFVAAYIDAYKFDFLGSVTMEASWS